jgi:hypothetical protein
MDPIRNLEATVGRRVAQIFLRYGFDAKVGLDSRANTPPQGVVVANCNSFPALMFG